MRTALIALLVASMAPFTLGQGAIPPDGASKTSADWAPEFALTPTVSGGDISVPTLMVGEAAVTWVVAFYRKEGGGWEQDTSSAFVVTADSTTPGLARLTVTASKLGDSAVHGLYELRLRPADAKPDFNEWKFLSVRLPEVMFQAPAQVFIMQRGSTLEAGRVLLIQSGRLPPNGVTVGQSSQSLQAGAAVPGALTFKSPASLGGGVWEVPIEVGSPFRLGDTTGSFRITSPTSAPVVVPFTFRYRCTQGSLFGGAMLAVLLAFVVRSVFLVKEKLSELAKELNELIDQVDRRLMAASHPSHHEVLQSIRESLEIQRDKCLRVLPTGVPNSVRQVIDAERKRLDAVIVLIEQERVAANDRLLKRLAVLRSQWSIAPQVHETVVGVQDRLSQLEAAIAAARPEGAPDRVDAAIQRGIAEVCDSATRWSVSTRHNLLSLAGLLERVSGESHVPALVSFVTATANNVIGTPTPGANGLEVDLLALAKLTRDVTFIAADVKRIVSSPVVGILENWAIAPSKVQPQLQLVRQAYETFSSVDAARAWQATESQILWNRQLESLVGGLCQLIRQAGGDPAVEQLLQSGKVSQAAAVIRAAWARTDDKLGPKNVEASKSPGAGLTPIPDMVHVESRFVGPRLEQLVGPSRDSARKGSLLAAWFFLLVRTVVVGIVFSALVVAAWGPSFVGTLPEWVGVAVLALGLDLSVASVLDKARGLTPKVPGL